MSILLLFLDALFTVELSMRLSWLNYPFIVFCCRTKFCNNSRKTHRTNFMLAVNLQQVNFTKMDYPEQVANIAKRVSKIVGERTLLDYLYKE